MANSSEQAADVPLIYGAAMSSFTRKVLLALQFKGIEHRCELPEMELFARLNPLAKMPILSIDGRTIIDSSVICDFLDRRYPDAPPLYPADIYLRTRALWLEEYIDTALQASIYPFVNEVLFKPLRYGQPSDPKVVEESMLPIGERLEYLEAELTGESFVEGGIGIADITLYSVLANPIRAGFPLDPARWPRLARHIETLRNSTLMAGHIARYDSQIPEVPEGFKTAPKS